AGFLTFAKIRNLLMPQGLAVDDVVAMPAPGIKHDGIVTGLAVKEPGRRCKALRPLGDGLLALGDDRIGHVAASAIMRPAVAFADPTTPGMPAPGWVPAPTI